MLIPGSPQSYKVEFLRVKPENLFFFFLNQLAVIFVCAGSPLL